MSLALGEQVKACSIGLMCQSFQKLLPHEPNRGICLCMFYGPGNTGTGRIGRAEVMLQMLNHQQLSGTSPHRPRINNRLYYGDDACRDFKSFDQSQSLNIVNDSTLCQVTQLLLVTFRASLLSYRTLAYPTANMADSAESFCDLLKM